MSPETRSKLKAAIRDNPDPDKAVNEVERILETPPLSPWWFSKERLDSLTRP